jgi:hypothetical protein
MRTRAMKSRTLTIVGLLGASALIASGCGGGEDGDGNGSESAVAAAKMSGPKTQFIREADTICTYAEVRQLVLLKQFRKRYGNPHQASEADIIRLAGLPPLRNEAEELAKLEPPNGEAEEVKGFIREFEKALKTVEATPTALTSQSPFATAEEKAKRYGFKHCGGP